MVGAQRRSGGLAAPKFCGGRSRIYTLGVSVLVWPLAMRSGRLLLVLVRSAQKQFTSRVTRSFDSRLLLSSCFLLVLGCSSEDPATSGGESDSADTSSSGDGDGDGDGDGGDTLRPNWHEDIAPLVYGSCVGCHFDGGIGPFSLETYEQAAPWSGLMRDAVADLTMPPWGAIDTEECQPQHDWRNDMRLSEEERQLFYDWAEAGSPEGDPANAVALPEPPNLDLEDATVVLQNPSPYVVGGNLDSFVCMVVDPGNTEEVWITGLQNIADNQEVVHHVLTYIDTDSVSDDLVDADGTFSCPGGFVNLDGANQVSTWVPGGVPTKTPEGVGFTLPVGAKIIMAYHYHPTGAGDESDQSSVALRWTTQEPAVKAFMGVVGAAFGEPDGLLPGPNDPDGVPVFEIPPNVSDHTETVFVDIPEGVPPIDIFTIGTHMHYVGVDMKIWIERDGEEICLLQTPQWDFNWQRLYDVDAPVGDMPKVQGGDTVYMRCTYDNTLGNPHLVEALAEQGLDEPITIGVGEQSLEEMCVNLFGLASNLPIDEFF